MNINELENILYVINRALEEKIGVEFSLLEKQLENLKELAKKDWLSLLSSPSNFTNLLETLLKVLVMEKKSFFLVDEEKERGGRERGEERGEEEESFTSSYFKLSERVFQVLSGIGEYWWILYLPLLTSSFSSRLLQILSQKLESLTLLSSNSSNASLEVSVEVECALTSQIVRFISFFFSTLSNLSNLFDLSSYLHHKQLSLLKLLDLLSSSLLPFFFYFSYF